MTYQKILDNDTVFRVAFSMQSNQEDHDFIDLQQYWLILKRRWLVVAIVIGSVFGLTVLFTFTQKPVYQAEGKNHTPKRSQSQQPSSRLTWV